MEGALDRRGSRITFQVHMTHKSVTFSRHRLSRQWDIRVADQVAGEVVLRRTFQFRIPVRLGEGRIVIQRILPRPLRTQAVHDLPSHARLAMFGPTLEQTATASRHPDNRWTISVGEHSGELSFPRRGTSTGTISGKAGAGTVSASPDTIAADLPARWTDEQSVFVAIAGFHAWLDSLPSAG